MQAKYKIGQFLVTAVGMVQIVSTRLDTPEPSKPNDKVIVYCLDVVSDKLAENQYFIAYRGEYMERCEASLDASYDLIDSP